MKKSEQKAAERRSRHIVRKVLKSVLAVVLAVLMAGANLVLPNYEQAVNSYVGFTQSWDNSGLDTAGLDLEYSKADYDAGSIKAAEEKLDEQIAAEGIVMLKNDGNSLPLAQGTTLSFIGGNSRMLGTIAGTAVENMLGSNATENDPVTPAFEAAGFSVNQTLRDFYSQGEGSKYVMGAGSVQYGDDEDFSINECPLSVMQDAGVLDSIQGTTPVFVLRRVAGEGRDMPRSMYSHADNPDDQARSYLEPDSTELEILQYLNDSYENVVLLVTTNSALELGWVDQFPNIRSILYVPTTGTYSMNSLSQIMAGSIDPSGRTVDTFAADALASPAAQNFGDYQYLNEDGSFTKYNYVSYKEGIYVGYRYYETRYEDAVLGQGNAGDFNYAQEVVYPFGYGLSYTDFSWSGYSASWDGETCTAAVTVTNAGPVAGRDVVELYAQSPYTDYDWENGVEKASVELVGFAKTKVLEPGESQTLSISFERSQLAAYDSEGAGTYIFDAGTYYIAAAHDAHDAVNCILAAKGAETGGDASRVAAYVPENGTVDTESYAADSLTGTKIENQLGEARGDISYLSRSDWSGTFPTHDGEPTSQISTWGNEINGEDGKSYTYGKTASAELIAQLDSTDSGNPDSAQASGEAPVYGANNGLTLADMRGLDFDDPEWDSLLDQLDPADYSASIRTAGYGSKSLASVGKPFGTDADSTTGWSWGGTGMKFCGPMMVAQTWNTDLASQLGEMIGNEALLGGGTGWYAPAMNIHRSAFSGRNGEYFSEDGFLSGAIASEEVRGVASKGVYTLIKHFAFNDQENHRGDRQGQYSMATWLNEQSAREIYLKPFEMCMKAGTVTESYVKKSSDGSLKNASREIRACQGLMTAFNRVGATWAGGCYSLIGGIVRGEWGFDGWIITDNADTGVFMDAGQMISAGADSKLTTADPAGTWEFDQNDSADYTYGREAMHHLLYTIANSHLMNGSMPGSRYVSGIYGTGLQLTDFIILVVNIVGIAGIALIAFTAWRNHRKAKKR